VVSEVWSPKVLRVQFGGKASELPVSEDDKTPAHKKYANRVSELWFGAHSLMKSGQIRGVDPDMAREMCEREYTTDKSGGDLRMRVESKEDMKARTGGRSPDVADAGFILVELCRERLKLVPSRRDGSSGNQRWLKQARRMDAVSSSVSDFYS